MNIIEKYILKYKLSLLYYDVTGVMTNMNSRQKIFLLIGIYLTKECFIESDKDFEEAGLPTILDALNNPFDCIEEDSYEIFEGLSNMLSEIKAKYDSHQILLKKLQRENGYYVSPFYFENLENSMYGLKIIILTIMAPFYNNGVSKMKGVWQSLEREFHAVSEYLPEFKLKYEEMFKSLEGNDLTIGALSMYSLPPGDLIDTICKVPNFVNEK